MKREAKPDVVELINKMREEIDIIGRKIDTLMSKLSPRPVEIKPPVKQENNFRERVLYKAVCADCRKECEVPFKPSGERPVYCKECFSKRRVISPFKANPNNRPVVSAPAPSSHIGHTTVIEKKKPAAKKKVVSRKKKK